MKNQNKISILFENKLFLAFLFFSTTSVGAFTGYQFGYAYNEEKVIEIEESKFNEEFSTPISSIKDKAY